MSTITVKDGTTIYYKDWGTGQPIVFSHGWPLNADAWDAQMLFLGQHGYRVIAHDRRSHGRSGQTWNGNEMDNLRRRPRDALRGARPQECRYDRPFHRRRRGGALSWAGTAPGAWPRPVLIGGPCRRSCSRRMQTPAACLSMYLMGTARAWRATVSQFFKDLTIPFYGYNRPGAKISEGVRENFWLQGMMGGHKGEYDCIKAFSETDFNEDLKKIDNPVLVLHGDDDQIVPIDASGRMTAKILKNATLKVLSRLSAWHVHPPMPMRSTPICSPLSRAKQRHQKNRNGRLAAWRACHLIFLEHRTGLNP